MSHPNDTPRDDDGRADEQKPRLHNDQTSDGDQAQARSADGHGSDKDKPPMSKRKRRRIMLTIAAIFVLIAVVWILLWLFVFSQREKTDDAYVGGNQVVVSAQVPGTVIAVMADDTGLVKAGQVLVKLDPTDSQMQLAKARSGLAHAVRQVRQLDASAAQADAGVDARKVGLAMARTDLRRREPLLADQAVAPETLAHLRDKVKSARSALKVAQRQAAAAHAAVDGSDVAHNPAVLEARETFRQAWLAVQRGSIVAPVGGYVAQRSVQVGQQIQPGMPLMQVIPLHHLWVDANLKESQLQHVRLGQPVKIETDLYGGDVTYHGKVAGMGAGTGSAFALLPPQNASGNWIKVVQRVPVRISLEDKELDKHPLRVGLSATVDIDTHDRNGTVLAQKPTTKPVAETRAYNNNFAAAEREADAIIRANMGSDAKPAPAASVSGKPNR